MPSLFLAMLEMPSPGTARTDRRMRLIFGLGLGLLAGVLIAARPSSAQSTPQLAHTDRTFEFIAFAPMPRVAPLFGAERERDWAPDWNPVFLWPDSAGGS